MTAFILTFGEKLLRCQDSIFGKNFKSGFGNRYPAVVPRMSGSAHLLLLAEFRLHSASQLEVGNGGCFAFQFENKLFPGDCH